MTTPSPPAEHSKRIAGYEILSKLGQGGMGAVYKARQLSLDRIVALKVLPKQLTEKPDFISRFSREARVTGQLNHPNIIKVFDVGRSSTGICYYSMEFVEGENLRAILEREKHLSAQRALKILEGMADALDHAYKHGVIHRDIKPDNIMIDMDGNVKLADLGLAKIAEDANPAAAGSFASLSGAVVGTPYYMSPEQAEGKTVDTRSDLYALGATAYHLLAGIPPFNADTPIGVITKHLTEPLPPLHSRQPSVPAALEDIIHRLMQKDPAKRFQTPAELEAALTRARAEISSPRARRNTAPKPASGKRWALAAAAAAGMLLVGLLVGSRSKKETPPVTTPPSSTGNPRIPKETEQAAQKALEEVNAYCGQHPRDYQVCLDSLKRILRDYPGSRAADAAKRQIPDLEAKLTEQQQAEALASRVSALIAEGRLPEAQAELEGLRTPSEAMASAIKGLKERIRLAQGRLPPPATAEETPRTVEPVRPDEALPENLKEAERLLSGSKQDARDLERLKELLSNPPADPMLAQKFNDLHRDMLRLECRQAVERTAAATYRAHDWKGVVDAAAALGKAYGSLANFLDGADVRWLERIERHARKNQELKAWTCGFEKEEARNWKTAKPEDRSISGKVLVLDNNQAKKEPERALGGSFALKVGPAALGDKGCNVEAQSPLFEVRPGAILRLKARLCLWYPKDTPFPKTPLDEMAYLCLRGDKGDLVPYDKVEPPTPRPRSGPKPPLARRKGLLEARALDLKEVWGSKEPEVISLDLSKTLLPDKINFGEKKILLVRLCAGISMEDVLGRSAQLILDDIELYYEEDPP